MGLKIFIPAVSKGAYLQQISNYTESKFFLENYKNYNPSYEIINIHWPEAIFDWKEPSSKDLESLREEMIKWKKTASIIYTKHDKGRVKGWTKNFKTLFELIEKNSDVFIHLGKYSKEVYLKKFPDKRHVVIPHPTFEDHFELFSKEEAREELKINKKALVITAPGQIRSQNERNLLLKSFRKLSYPNKVLISTNMRNEMNWDFPGRIKIKNLFDFQSYVKANFIKKYVPPKYLFSYAPQERNDFSLRIAAADIIFVPRIDLLNSGNVLLGLTFNKVTVGPAIGNIKEQLEEHNLPVFNPNSISSAVEAIEKGIVLCMQGYRPVPREKYNARQVSRAYDNLFYKISRSET